MIFFVPVTPVYWLMSRDPTGTAALALTVFLLFMIFAFLALVARKIDARPEDRNGGEILEGAGEQGFFPPQSIWPFYCALTVGIIAMGPVFGWWLTILGMGLGIFAVTGLVYQYYRGDHAH